MGMFDNWQPGNGMFDNAPSRSVRYFDEEFQNRLLNAVNQENSTRPLSREQRRFDEIMAARGADLRKQVALNNDSEFINVNGHYLRRDKNNSLPEYSIGQYENEVRKRHRELDNIRKHYGLEEEDLAGGQNLLNLETELDKTYAALEEAGKTGSPDWQKINNRFLSLKDEIELQKTNLGEKKLSGFRQLIYDRTPRRQDPGLFQKTLSWMQGNGFNPEDRNLKAWGRFRIALKNQYNTDLASPLDMELDGKLGFGDTLSEIADDPTKVVPFLRFFDIRNTHIQDAAIRQQDGFQMYLAAAKGDRGVARTAYNNDKALLEKYKNDQLKELIQGVGFWKQAGDVITQLPAYGVEIGMTGFGSGAAKAALSKLPGAAKLAAETPKFIKAGASVVGNTAHPGRVFGMILPMAAQLTNQQMLHEAVKQDEFGNWSYDPESVSPGTAFWDNVLRSTFEVGSEMTGPLIGEVGSKLMPKFMRNIGKRLSRTALARVFRNKTMMELLKKGHIDGLPEEVMEETLNNFACYATALDTSGAKDPEDFLDRMLAFAENEPRNMATNAAIFAVLPAAGLMANTAATLASRRRQAQKLEQLTNHAKVSFDEAENIVNADQPQSPPSASSAPSDVSSPPSDVSSPSPATSQSRDLAISQSDEVLPHNQTNPIREETPQFSEAATDTEQKENIYLRMPIERVRQDAENGVLLAQRALALRKSELEIPPGQSSESVTSQSRDFAISQSDLPSDVSSPSDPSDTSRSRNLAISQSDLLNSRLANAYESEKAPHVELLDDSRLSPKHLAVKNLMWNTFRKPIVFFEGREKNLPDGVSIGNGTIYVNKNASNPYLFAAFHEFYHENKNSVTGREIADVLLNAAHEGSFRRWMDHYNANLNEQGYKTLDVEELKEEFIADSLGTIANKESFWKEMAREKSDILQKFLAWLQELKESFQSRFRNADSVKDVIHDMERAERMITTIMKKEARRHSRIEIPRQLKTFTTPQGEMKVNGSYEVVDASELVTSDMPSYNQRLQPRNRNTMASQAQIEKISSHINPDLLLESPSTDTGAPIVDMENQVVSGNGRSIGIKQAIKKGRSSEYHARVRKWAAENNIEINPEVKNPVLVRRIAGKVNLEALAEFSNRDNKLQRTDAEQAEADAKTLINNNLLSIFNPAEDGTILVAQNNDFTSQFIRASGDFSMLNSEGMYSSNTEKRIRNAILAALFINQKDSRNLIRRLMEQSNELGLKRQIDGVSAVAGRLLRIAESKKGYDLRDDLAEAFRKLLAFKKEDNRGKELSEALDAHLNQGNFFETGSSKESELLFKYLGLSKSVKQIREYLSSYSDTVDRIDPNTGNMFGFQDENKYEILKRLLENEQTPDLFQNENSSSVSPSSPSGTSASSVMSSDEKLMADYEKRFGNVLNTDNMKLLFPEYNPHDEKSVRSNHPEAGRLVGKMFDRAVEKLKPGDTVIFTGGGNGSGKSSVLKDVSGAAFVMDSTMANAEMSGKSIQKVLDKGGKPVLAFTYRDPVDAWFHGVQKRNQSKDGHVVPETTFANTHVNARKSFIRLAERFAGKVDLLIKENQYEKKPREITLDELKNKKAYTKEEILEAINGIRSGRIQQTMGRQVEPSLGRQSAGTPGGRNTETGRTDRGAETASPGLPGRNPEVKEETPSSPASPSRNLAISQSRNLADIPGILSAQITSVKKAALLRKYAKDHGMTVKQMQEEVEAYQVIRAREVARNPKLSRREKFDRILAIYEQQPPLNERTSTSMENQAYSTPLPLAFLCGEAIHIDSASAVYEPTAGNGALLISADPDAVHANEIEETRRRTLEDMRTRYVTGRDATGYKPGGRFDAVIMNPPFGTLKEKIKVNGYYNIGKLEHQIAVKALEVLAPDGRAAMILGASLDKGKFTSTEMPFMNYLYNNFKVADNFELDGELYRKQGASYPVRVILLSGRLAETDNHEKDAPKTVDRLKNWNDIYNRMEGIANETDERRKIDDAGIQRRGMGKDRESSQHDSLSRSGEDTSENIRGSVHDAVEFPAESVQGRTGDRTSESEIHTGTGKGKTSESAVDGGRAGLPGDMGGRGNLSDQSPVRASDGGGSSGKTGGAAGRHASGFVSDHSGNDGRLTQTEMTPAPSGASAKSDVSGPSPATSQSRDLAISQSSNDLQNRYQPKSKAESLGTMIPKFMRSESEKALTRLQEWYGDIDEFVRKQLGYDTKEELYGALAAEQIDSVALAIDNISRGESIIIGDQTGIGKGRQAAALMRYAKRHGLIPVFFTEKPKLFSDMYGDGLDIGERFKPFLIGNKNESHIKDSENGIIQECMSPARQQKYSASFMKENPEKFDAVFCCYSQVRDKENWQKNFFRTLFKNKKVMLVMDEAHNASGDESNTNKFFKELIGLNRSTGAVFLSATYAKRPDNMVLFALKNNLGKILQGKELVDVIKQGGLALQQVISQGLAEAGQLIRRERDFTGVKVNMDVQKVSPEIITQYDQVSNFMSELVQFSEDLKESMKDENVKAGKKQKTAIETCSFGSIVHNYIAQLIFASKLDLAAKHAVKAYQNGQKTVIALANTLESFLKDYMENNSLSAGDAANVTFRDVLVNALEKMKFGRRNDKGGNSEIVPITFKPEIQAEYDRLIAMIDEINVELPASPIDYLKAKLQAAGLRVGELTGRENIIQYDENGENGILGIRKNDANGTVNDFNAGKYDAVILNRAGSTGLSLHSSKKFKDQKQRHMFVVQADLDINIVQQMLGRVLRSGQVNKPEYTFLSTDLEAERRVMSILKKKLASLSANTTANTKSGMQLKGEDFLNKYGDQVVSEFLAENPRYMVRSGVSVESAANGKVKVKEDIARNFTGKMALFSNAEQKAIYDELSERYSDLVDRLKAMGEYDLEITDKDWRAQELSSEIYEDGDPFGGIFKKPLVMKTLKTIEKRMVPDKLTLKADRLKQFGSEDISVMREKFKTQFQEQRKKLEAYYADRLRESANAKERVKLLEEKEKYGKELNQAENCYSSLLGFPLTVQDGMNTYYGTLSYIKFGKMGNPGAASNMRVSFLVEAPIRITAQASQIGDGKNIQAHHAPHGITMDSIFTDRNKREFEMERKVFVGNILKGVVASEGNGKIVRYTTADGRSEMGVVMPNAFQMSELKNDPRRKLNTPDEIIRYLNRYQEVTGDFGLEITQNYGAYRIYVDKKKASGGQIYLDSEIRNIVGEFRQNRYRNNMELENHSIDEKTFRKVLPLLMAKTQISGDLEKVKKLRNSSPVKLSVPQTPRSIQDYREMPAHEMPPKAQFRNVRELYEIYRQEYLGQTVTTVSGHEMTFKPGHFFRLIAETPGSNRKGMIAKADSAGDAIRMIENGKVMFNDISGYQKKRAEYIHLFKDVITDADFYYTAANGNIVFGKKFSGIENADGFLAVTLEIDGNGNLGPVSFHPRKFSDAMLRNHEIKWCVTGNSAPATTRHGQPAESLDVSRADYTLQHDSGNVNSETKKSSLPSSDTTIKLSVSQFEKDQGKIRGFFTALFEKDVNGKKDVNVIAKHLGTIFHYSRRVPSLFRTYLAAADIVVDKTRIRNWMFNGKTGRDIWAEMKAFRKRDPENYRKMNDYLLERDRNRDGLDVALKTDDTGKEFFTVIRPDGTSVSSRYSSEDEAWEMAWSQERRNLMEAGFSEEAADFVYQWRHVFDRVYQNYKGYWESVKDAYEENGEGKIPFINGVDIDAELRKMGALRGSYFPRIRHGNLLLSAEKKGENPRTEAFTNHVTRAARAAKLRSEGYKVTLKLAERPAEEAFSGASVAALNDFANNAFKRMNAKSDTTFRDFGLMPDYEQYKRKDGRTETHLILRGNKGRFDKVMKNFGGQYYQDGWRFRNVDATFEKSLLQAVAIHVGIVSGDVNLFGKALAEQLAILIHTHGSRSAMIGRNDAIGQEVHLGYEEDALKAMTLAVSSAAGGSAKGIAARKMLRAFTGTDVSFEEWAEKEYPNEAARPDYGVLYEKYRKFVDDRRIDSALQPLAYKAGTEFMTDIMRNDTDTEHVFGVMRGVMATYYLSRPSSGAINLSTMAINVPAMMSAYGGVTIRHASALISRESKHYLRYMLWNKYGKGTPLSETNAWVYRKIHEHGWDESQMSDEAAGEIMTWGGRTWRQITGISLFSFAATEQFNRNVTIAAAFRGLMEQEKEPVTEARMEELLKKAKTDISDRAHGVYGKINLPDAMRGSSAGAQAFRLFYTYKTYTHNYLQSMVALGLKKPKELAWMALSPAILAGAPATVLTPLAGLVFSALGLEPPDGVEAEFYRWMRKTFGNGGERFGRMGLAGLAGVNLTGSMSMTGITELPTTAEELLGAPYSMAANIVKGVGNATHGNLGKAAEQLLPAILAAPVKAAREASRGITKKNNQPVIYEGEQLRPNTFDIVMRAIGFNPASISEKREKLWEQQRARSYYREKRSAIYNNVRDWYVSGRKSGQWAAILKDVEEYNARVQRSGRKNIPMITEEVLKRTIKNASKGK